MAKLLSLIFILLITVGMNILVMIKGWGLEPKSYFWAVGVYIITGIFTQTCVQTILKEDK